MFSLLFIFMVSFLVGITAITLSVLAWRLKSNVLFWFALVVTGILAIIYLYHYEWLYIMLISGTSSLLALLLLAFLILPIGFLIAAKSKGHSSETDLTDDYLNSIINSEEKDIDYES